MSRIIKRSEKLSKYKFLKRESYTKQNLIWLKTIYWSANKDNFHFISPNLDSKLLQVVLCTFFTVYWRVLQLLCSSTFGYLHLNQRIEYMSDFGNWECRHRYACIQTLKLFWDNVFLYLSTAMMPMKHLCQSFQVEFGSALI